MPSPHTSTRARRLSVEHLEDRLNPANPLALADSYGIAANATLNATAALGVLSNDVTAGSPLSARLIQQPAHGTVSLASDGSFTYTPSPGFTGTDTFYYHLMDAAQGGYALYTVDAEDDKLVTIDRVTGVYKVIGDIGYDMYNTDLAVLGDTIYALTANGPTNNPQSWALIGINPITGAMVSSVQLSVPAPGTLTDADGLAVVGGELYVSYFASNLPTSNIGKVDLSTGLITFVQGYTGYGSDPNGLGSDGTTLYGVDVEPFSGSLRTAIFEEFSLASPTYSFISNYTLPNIFISDLAVTPFGVYGVDTGTRTLIRYDTSFIQQGTVLLGNGAASLIGLDWAPASESIGKVSIFVGVPVVPPASPPVTKEDTQVGGLVVLRAPGEGSEVTHFRVTDIQHGTLYKSDGISVVPVGGFITVAEGLAGLKFTPDPNYFGPASFTVRSSSSGNNSGVTDSIYTIDSITDRLIKLSAGGVATPIGTGIGVNMSASDLTYGNGAFYASTLVGTTWTLVRINPQTGASTLSVPFSITGHAGPLSIHGLEFQKGKLFVAYSDDGSDASSIGEVNPTTGVITPNYDFQDLGFNYRFDAIASDGAGPLHALSNQLYSAPLSFVTFSQLTLQPGPGIVGLNDNLLFNPAWPGPLALDFAMSKFSVYALDSVRRELQLFDRTTFGLTSLVSLGTGSTGYTGIAIIPAPSGISTTNIEVFAINDAPTITGADVSVDEDSSATVLPGFVAFNPGGGSDESGQSLLGYTVTNVSNPSLFSVLPTIDLAGNLTYALAPNVSGSTTITVIARDDGGTANGGVDTSTPQNITFTVKPINDAPSYNVGGTSIAVNEDAVRQTISGPFFQPGGGADEANQKVANSIVSVTGITGNLAFSTPPTVDAAGNITFAVAPNTNGTATLQIIVQDSGSGVAPSVNTSAPQVFTITVDAVNDRPVVSVPVNVNAPPGGSLVKTGFAVFFPGGGLDEVTQTPTYLLTPANPALFSVQPTIDAKGTLRFTLAPGVSGPTSVVVQVRDSGGTAKGGTNLSLAKTFTINGNGVVSPPTPVPPSPPVLPPPPPPPIPSAGAQIIVVGSDAGGVSRVRVLDATTRAVLNEFAPFAGYAGGVNAVSADVNGDGIKDVIVATKTLASHVKVFSAAGAEMMSFLAFPGFNAGLSLAAGDVDGDGRADIIVGTATATSHVKVFSGLNGGVTQSFLAFAGFGGGVRVAAGDVTGDGRADVAVVAGPGGNGHIKVFDGLTNQVATSFLGYQGYQGEINLAVGDVTGDGLGEIITAAQNPLFGAHVKAVTAQAQVVRSFFAPTATGAGVNQAPRVAAVDLNGDRIAEFLVSDPPGGSSHKLIIIDGVTTAVVQELTSLE